MSGKVVKVSDLTLSSFLDDHRIISSKDKTIISPITTHTGWGSWIGSYHIPQKNLKILYKLILKNNSMPSITELIQDKTAPKKMFIDFDFRQKSSERLISGDDIAFFAGEYASVILTYSDVKKITIYVQQRAEPYLDGDIYKDGLHFIIPDFQCSIDDQLKIRQNIMKDFPSEISGRFINPVKDKDIVESIVDEAVIGCNGWFLQGCGKPGKTQYNTVYCAEYFQSETNEADGCTLVIPPIDTKFINLCSMASTDKSICYKVNLPDLPDKKPKMENVKPKKTGIKKSAMRIKKVDIDDEFRDIFAALPLSYGVEYKTWYETMCICQFHEVSYEVVDASFSSLREGYNEENNRTLWDSIKNDKPGQYTKKTLYWEIKNSNPEKYKELLAKYRYSSDCSGKYDLDFIIKYDSDKNLAKLYAATNKNRAKFMLFQKGTTNEWYYLNENNIWISNGSSIPSDLRIDIGDALEPIFLAKIEAMNADKCKLNDEIDEEKEVKRKAKNKAKKDKTEFKYDCSKLDTLKEKLKTGNILITKIDKIINKVGDATETDGIIKYLLSYFKNNVDDVSMFHNKNYFACNNKLFDCTFTIDSEGIKTVRGWRDIEPEDYITQTTGYDYAEVVSETITEEIKVFLQSFFDADSGAAGFFTKQIARTLNGDMKTNQVFNIMLGNGDNGKSFLFDILSKIFGKYYGSLDVMHIVNKNKHPEGPTPAMYELMGKRIVAINEPEANVKLHEGIVKTLTSGSDMISARMLGKNPVSFCPQALLNLLCNFTPRYSDTSEGMSKRIKLHDFCMKFTEEVITKEALEMYPNLRKANPLYSYLFDKLEYKQAFIKHLSTVYLNTFSQSTDTSVHVPKSVMSATQKFNNENNVIAKWLEENYDVVDKTDKDAYMKTSYSLDDLLDAYLADTEDKLVHKNNIGGLLKKAGVELKRIQLSKDSDKRVFRYVGYVRKTKPCLIKTSPSPSSKSE